jgi:hypothetical protein
MKIPVTLVFIAFIFYTGCSSSRPANTASTEETKQAIVSDQWTFVAQSAIPQGGRSRMLTTRYEMRVSKDTIIAYLPYFGRSFSGAGAMTNPNPLDFKSVDFSINREEKNKGGWRVTVKPKDINSIQSMLFELYENGSANLNVTLTDRTPISFVGTVEPVK